MFRSLLVANRGEIARRVFRTARSMGLRTVAVYTKADRTWPHWTEADDAILVGDGPARESYLDIEVLIDVAGRAGAEAIHPGYGFLSENADFAAACEAAGLIFVGPAPSTIRAMGSKAEAKALMQAAGIPVVPGYHGDEPDSGRLAAEADQIGFPLLIKASAGGGGRGMRTVRSPADFVAALDAARREALSSFGDGAVILERLVPEARHIEVQVMADQHGNIVHLGERDCSVQRRHQKIIEESPAPDLPHRMREEITAAAIAAARTVDYRGAGTVEFLLDQRRREYFFLEMNTRLQVEHPVTEFVTGLDLVEWQLRIAAGERLPIAQREIKCAGHAFEARLYAEDPAADFRPSAGRVHCARFPEKQPGVRIDSGVVTGSVVSEFYDPMLAKIVVWGDDRDEARRALIAALRDTWVAGPATNQGYLLAIAGHPEFSAGATPTSFLAAQAESLVVAVPEWGVSAAITAWHVASAEQATERISGPWARRDGFEVGGLERQVPLRIDVAGGTRVATVTWRNGSPQIGPIDGPIVERPSFDYIHVGSMGYAVADGVPFQVSLAAASPAKSAQQESGLLRAPLNGRIGALLVRNGETVLAGEPVAVIEAMKMEHSLVAPFDAVAETIEYAVGDQVSAGTIVAELVPLATGGAAENPD